MKATMQTLLAGLLWASLASASPIGETEVTENPCLAPALKVNVQEIRGAHVHEGVQVASYKQCCEACWKKKGCALFTYVKEDALGNTNYCRLTYPWEPTLLAGTPNKCADKITTGYEATDGADGRFWNFGAGPCGQAVDCKGSCVAA